MVEGKILSNLVQEFFHDFYSLPIITEECLCESQRINKIRELLGMEI